MRHVSNNWMRTPINLSPIGVLAEKALTSESPESAMKPSSSLKFIVAGLLRSRAAQTEKGEGLRPKASQIASI